MKRRLAWRQALADLKADRMTRPAIREERVRCVGGTMRLGCWRGRSGRRYVVVVHTIADALDAWSTGAIGLAVARDAAGRAELRALGLMEDAAPWLAGAVEAGASELHLYRLADTPAELRAALADLSACEA